EKLFEKKNILVVDDDMRNLFALTQILEDKGMSVLKAEDGKKAVDALQNGHNIDLVLMDIMMPVMDGYEAMQTIRKQSRFKSLPIIALTAKAMKEDREKCISAGASDYLTKPVNVDKLLSLMRVWLYK
ncbi:MAG: response regulator, partial [Bacteroidota bacterium]|nr:response regulator [Bacteroidota bacterium]